MDQKIEISTIIKVLFIIAFLPFVLMWYVWKKTSWSNQNKWIATTGIVVFCLFILASPEDSEPKQQINQESLRQELAQNTESQVNNSDSEARTQDVIPAVLGGDKLVALHVVDGDTIKLNNGQVVRYIGIDTPETVDPRKPVQCFGKEASAKNKELVEGKEIRLVKDTSETDKYKRLLRYVYVGDIFVNDYLVRNGYAHSSSYPPDVKHQEQFREAEQEAKENKRGLWADGACDAKESVVSASVIIPKPTTASSLAGSYVCNCGKTCAQMNCSEAQYQLNTCGCSARDRDGDGTACDSDCQ